jgi:hypothetical protein
VHRTAGRVRICVDTCALDHNAVGRAALNRASLG